MKIIIKYFNSEAFTFDLKPETTIGELKELVGKKFEELNDIEDLKALEGSEGKTTVRPFACNSLNNHAENAGDWPFRLICNGKQLSDEDRSLRGYNLECHEDQVIVMHLVKNCGVQYNQGSRAK